MATFAVLIFCQIVQIQSSHLLGYNYALASSLRNGPLRGLESSFEALASPEYKLTLIWVRLPSLQPVIALTVPQGTADRTVPYRYSSRIQQLVPNCTLVTIPEGPHDLTISHPDTVNEALLKFLRAR